MIFRVFPKKPGNSYYCYLQPPTIANQCHYTGNPPAFRSFMLMPVDDQECSTEVVINMNQIIPGYPWRFQYNMKYINDDKYLFLVVDPWLSFSFDLNNRKLLYIGIQSPWHTFLTGWSKCPIWVNLPCGDGDLCGHPKDSLPSPDSQLFVTVCAFDLRALAACTRGSWTRGWINMYRICL